MFNRLGKSFREKKDAPSFSHIRNAPYPTDKQVSQMCVSGATQNDAGAKDEKRERETGEVHGVWCGDAGGGGG